MSTITILALLISQISANTIFGPGSCNNDRSACAIKCNSTYPCSGSRIRPKLLTCAPGTTCAVQCTSPDACTNARINVNGAAVIAFQCTAPHACTSAFIYGDKAETAIIEVECTAPNACEEVDIRINRNGVDHLEVQCTAENACELTDIHAAMSTNQQRITLWCTTPGACSDMEITKGRAYYDCIDNNDGACNRVSFNADSGDDTNGPSDSPSDSSDLINLTSQSPSDSQDELVDNDVDGTQDISRPRMCYDTDEKNPCTPIHKLEEKFYFASCTSCCNFIQCNANDEIAHDMKCQKNTYWDKTISACAHNDGQCTDMRCRF